MMKLDERMKFYETNTPNIMTNILPFVCRLDGKAFHTYTKRYNKPFDKELSDKFCHTAYYLLKETGAKAAYTQSDEISLLFWNDNYTTEYFLGGKRDKLNSVLASMCTYKFNIQCNGGNAIFDCRTFQIPNMGELINYYIWRYKDCIRNSVQALGQSVFSHKELQNKNINDIKSMLDNHGNSWYETNNIFKYGLTMIRNTKLSEWNVSYYTDGFDSKLPLYPQVEKIFG